MTRASLPDQYLSLGPVTDDLRARSVRGGAVTMVAQALRFILQIGSLAVLGRLLAPDDFGLLAMVLSVTALAERFKDLGLAMATVQRPEITHDQVSTLFWINIAFGVLVSLIVASLAPLITWFFDRPELFNITLVLAATFALAGVGVQHLALLRRQMRFNAVAIVQVMALTIAVLAAIIAAWRGAGYWALVVQTLVTAGATSIGAWIACAWRPGRPVRRSGARDLLAFGTHLSASNILSYLVRNLDNILIGRSWGADALGLYSKAYQLLLLPIAQFNSPITNVAIPTLSRLQDDPARFRLFYRYGLLILTSIGMPVVALLFAAADSAVLTVLGNQWVDAPEIFRWLAPAAFVGTFNVASGWVFIALGHTDRHFRWSLISTPIVCTAFAIGLPYGPVGVAAGLSIAMVALRPFGLAYCYRGTFVTMGDFLRAIWRPTIASAVACGATLSVQPLVTVPPPVMLILAGTFFSVIYAIIWIVMPGGLPTFRELIALRRDLRTTAPESGA